MMKKRIRELWNDFDVWAALTDMRDKAETWNDPKIFVSVVYDKERDEIFVVADEANDPSYEYIFTEPSESFLDIDEEDLYDIYEDVLQTVGLYIR